MPPDNVIDVSAAFSAMRAHNKLPPHLREADRDSRLRSFMTKGKITSDGLPLEISGGARVSALTDNDRRVLRKSGV